MHKNNGYTLIEMIYTLLIMAIILAISIPIIANLIDKWSLNSIANELAEDLRYAQHTALTTNSKIDFEIYYNNMSYKIKTINMRDSPLKTVYFNDTLSKIESNLSRSGSYGYLIYFTRTGSPGQTGTIILTSKKGNKKTITIAVSTGRIEVKNE